MAGIPTDPAKLKALITGVLAEVKPRELLTGQEMAALVGLSWLVFRRRFVDPDNQFPINSRGREGTAWQFQAARALKHIIKRCDEQAKANRERNMRATASAGITLAADEQGADLAEVVKLADLTLRTQSSKERQQKYKPVADVADFLGDYNSAVVQGILGVAFQVDPSGSLPPVVRLAMEERLRSLAAHVHDRAASFIERLDAGSREGRT